MEIFDQLFLERMRNLLSKKKSLTVVELADNLGLSHSESSTRLISAAINLVSEFSLFKIKDGLICHKFAEILTAIENKDAKSLIQELDYCSPSYAVLSILQCLQNDPFLRDKVSLITNLLNPELEH